jgi:hypothetical protein
MFKALSLNTLLKSFDANFVVVCLVQGCATDLRAIRLFFDALLTNSKLIIDRSPIVCPAGFPFPGPNRWQYFLRVVMCLS